MDQSSKTTVCELLDNIGNINKIITILFMCSVLLTFCVQCY